MRAQILAVLAVAVIGCGGGSGASNGADGGGTPDTPDTSAHDAPSIPATPANVWTWVEVPGTTCGNGTPAGFGINRLDGAVDLFVSFEGGGACWDAETCFTSHTAVNIDATYGAAKLAADVGSSPVDRSPGNPFAAATLVWVPYCTGDLHAGTRVMDYGAAGSVHHTGSTNTARFIEALRAQYASLHTVWLTGSSAGGYGATLNLPQFTAAWPEARIHVLQDSSPFVPVLANYATWQSAWALQFPPNCPDCVTRFPAVIDALTAAHPSSRIGLLTYDDDAVVKAYFGYPAGASLVPATTALLSNQYAGANTHAFVLAGGSHTMLGQLATLTSPSGVRLADWVAQWANGEAAWATVTP